MNSSDKAYEEQKFIAEFIGCEECFLDGGTNPEEFDKAIAEIEVMIQHNLEVGNKKEVANWRRLLQQTKVAKRRAKKMIEKRKTEDAEA